ncbi:MAG: hypothetical protein ACLFNT_06010 [Spirochaetales bacterium]
MAYSQGACRHRSCYDRVRDALYPCRNLSEATATRAARVEDEAEILTRQRETLVELANEVLELVWSVIEIGDGDPVTADSGGMYRDLSKNELEKAANHVATKSSENLIPKVSDTPQEFREPRPQGE